MALCFDRHFGVLWQDSESCLTSSARTDPGAFWWRHSDPNLNRPGAPSAFVGSISFCFQRRKVQLRSSRNEYSFMNHWLIWQWSWPFEAGRASLSLMPIELWLWSWSLAVYGPSSKSKPSDHNIVLHLPLMTFHLSGRQVCFRSYYRWLIWDQSILAWFSWNEEMPF